MFQPIIGVAFDLGLPSVGRPRTPITIAAGESGKIPFTGYRYNGSTPYPNANTATILTVWSTSRSSPIISRELTVTDPTNLVGYWDIYVEDTTGREGAYKYDVRLTDGNFTPNKGYQMHGVAAWSIGEALGVAGQAVTALSSLTPLGQGLSGNPRFVSTAVKVAPYTAAFNDSVLFDPTGGAIAITLPLASTAVNGVSDYIQICNVSDANGGSVILQGGDLINGLNFFFIDSWESVTLKAYAAGKWKTV